MRRLSSSATPFLRIAGGVEHAENLDCIPFAPVEDHIGKSGQFHATDVIEGNRVSERVGLDFIKATIQSNAKPIRRFLTALLVPSERILHVRSDKRMKSHVRHPSLD